MVRIAKQTTDGHLVELARANGAVLATLDTKIPGAYFIRERAAVEMLRERRASMLRSQWMQRAVLAIIGLSIVALGAGALLQGSLHFLNLWGGMVFAPFSIFIGAAAELIAAFFPNYSSRQRGRRAASEGCLAAE